MNLVEKGMDFRYKGRRMERGPRGMRRKRGSWVRIRANSWGQEMAVMLAVRG